MAEQQFLMTQKAYDDEKERLVYLQTVKRREIVERIKEARDHGDLSENAEYDAARNEQAANESEIMELEYKLKNASIVEETTDVTYVHIGSKVIVYDAEMDMANESEITDLEYKLKNATIIKISTDVSQVHIGSKVLVYDTDMEEDVTYEITGSTEADPMNNKISNESPVGAALMKRKLGETVTVKAPEGDYSLTIKKIF